MFKVNKDDKTIHCTRGDIGLLEVGKSDLESGEPNLFYPGDTVRFKLTKKNDCNDVILQKDYIVTSEKEIVSIVFSGQDTKIGPVINKPVNYWYEIELNPDTAPETLIGYDDVGAKIFRLYPEGGDFKGVDVNE